MSKLDDIFKEYRQSCFLAKDINLDDRAVTLLANQQISSKNAIKDLMLELIDYEQKAIVTGNNCGHLENVRMKVEEL